MVTIKGTPTYQQRTSKSSGRPYKVWTFDDTDGHHYVGVYLAGAVIQEGDEIDLRQTDKGWEVVKEAPAKPVWQPKDENAIKAMWAIGQAVQMNLILPVLTTTNIEEDAKALFEMVDRVKLGRSEEVIKDAGDFKMINPLEEDLPPIENYDA